jgi:malonate transporter and related proteins
MPLMAQYFVLSVPLFGIVFAGYALALWKHWPGGLTVWLSTFVFAVALPAYLFRMMSGFSRLPPVDSRLLFAFFGSCLIVFIIGRIVGAQVFRLDGVSQSIFGLGGVFSNNVMLGLPLARVTLGEESVPAVALVLIFNALILWTLVTVSIEWARHGTLTRRGFARTAWGVITNPLIVAIVLGTLFGMAGFELPRIIDQPLIVLGQIASPLSLAVVGMGLAGYGIRDDWHKSAAITSIKLVLQPLVVWGLAVALDLPPLETKTVVLLASCAVGANVYLMSIQFRTLQGAVAGSLVISTAVAAISTPVFLTVLAMVL